MTSPLRIAVPNKGRLKTPATDLLRDAGLSFEATERVLSVRVDNADIDLLFVRTEDIPELVSDGVADLGITGIDLLAEYGFDDEPPPNRPDEPPPGRPEEAPAARPLEVVLELGFGRCRLAAAVPNASELAKTEDFAGRRIATAHPRITTRYFTDRGVDVTVVPLRGSVEVATKLGVADGIVDLVSSGSTLRVNGLRETGTLLESEAVLVSGGPQNGRVDRVATAIGSVVAARRKRYLLLNAPNEAVEEIAALIPGLDSPTVMPLAGDQMCAVHSVVDSDDVWHLLPRLEEAGARGILVLPIEQLIP